MQRLIPSFTQVLFPGLSKIKADLDRVTEGYCRGLKVMNAVILPLVMVIVVCSPLAVPMLFGAHWSVAVPLIQILSVIAAMRVIMGPTGVLLMSQGRPDITFYWNIGLSTLGAAVMAGVAAVGDLTDVAIAFAGVYVVLGLIHPFVLLRPVLPDIRIGQLLHAVAAPLLLSCLSGVGAVIAAHLMPWGGLAELVVQCLAGVLIYVFGFLLLDRAFMRETSALLVLRPRTPG
jgi:lipopolysaccharide exporter